MAAFHRPTDLTEALGVLAQGDVTVAAGCTDLYPATQAKALAGPVLDITAINDLRGITQTDAGWRIGATTSWSDLLTTDLPPAFDGLKLAAQEVGSIQIQNAGTLAGNLCTASPAADGAPCLMALDAMIELQSAKGKRTLPLIEFLLGPRRTALRPDELLTAIHIPNASAQGRSTFLKLGARKYLIISIAMVSVRLEITGDIIDRAAISVGSCSPVAVRLSELETSLKGCSATDPAALITPNLIAPALSPIDDIRADAAYRLTAATELTRRAISQLAGQKLGQAA